MWMMGMGWDDGDGFESVLCGTGILAQLLVVHGEHGVGIIFIRTSALWRCPSPADEIDFQGLDFH
jgi:hypothetical protein